MQSVAVDQANPEDGEAAYILQLSLPLAAGGETGVLMDQLGRYVDLYLSRAEPAEARFAQMGGTTWVIAASDTAASTLEQLRVDLATTLYGHDDGQRVQLEWPSGLDPAQPDKGEAPDLADDLDFEMGDAPTASTAATSQEPDLQTDEEAWVEAEPEPTEDQNRDLDGAGELEADLPHLAMSPAEVDLMADSLDLDAFELAESPDHSHDQRLEPGFEAGGIDDAPVPDADPDGSDQDLAFLIEDSVKADPRDDVEADGWMRVGENAAQRAAFDDDNDVFEIDALDIELVDRRVEPDGEPDAEFERNISAPTGGEMDDFSSFETLTEAPERPAKAGIADELAAFRAEMREIASSIPGAPGGETLADFRAELEAISGALGQRVDGAAQRIEAAASDVVEATSRLDAQRLNAAAERAERSTAQLEEGVADALNALNAAMTAMVEQSRLTPDDAAGEG
jgi:hypothetical protein